MPSSPSTPATRIGMLVAAAALALALIGTPEPVSAGAPTLPSASVERSTPASAAAVGGWVWPVQGAHRVLRGFEAPASRYSAGHRGIDVAAQDGDTVAAPTDGVVRFAGVVVDRSTLTIATSDDVLISMEPVTTQLKEGTSVARGSAVGSVSTGGHCSSGCLHLGVRVAGDYVSPLRFFGGVPRAVLLPMR